jgi:hypothetical protein
MRLSLDVDNNVSPIGVAPPVSDDCAPIVSTRVAPQSTSTTSASLAGVAIARA